MIYLRFILLGILWMWMGCATPTVPTGGPRDVQPPKLDSSRYSTPNRQTNFREKEIILTFNEWVQLKDAQKQVLISPPMKKAPKIKIKNKSVVLLLDDTLRANTTYTINFGNAIADITESNVAPNMRFVFSTGDKLDSLKTGGKIVDAQTGTAKENVWLMLYDNMNNDSLPLKERPYYCAKTNKDGIFQLENLKAGSYKVFALEDKNNNYLYDLPNEAIGFWKEPLVLNDSVQPSIQLRLFEPEPPLKVQTAKQAHIGAISLRFSRRLRDSLRLLPINLPADYTAHWAIGTDTARLWFKGALVLDTTYQWQVWEGDRLLDTIAIKHSKTPAMPQGQPMELYLLNKVSAGKNSKTGNAAAAVTRLSQHPQQPIQLTWNRPLLRIDTARCWVLDDSTQQRILVEISVGEPPFQQITFRGNWRPQSSVQVVFLPQSLEDFYGAMQSDTVRQVYQMGKPEDYGTILALVSGADSTRSYVLQLIGSNEEVLDRISFSGQRSFSHTFARLKPQSYTLRLLHDANGNGRWDAGDYLKGEQPETMTNSNSIQLRANWENEIELLLDGSAPPPKKTDGSGKKGKF